MGPCLSRKPRPRLIIADPCKVMLIGMRCMLRKEFNIVAEALTGREAFDKTVAHGPDFLVMDPQMSGLVAVSLLRMLTQRQIATKVILFASERDQDMLFDCLHSGACGFVLKGDGDNLAEAIRAAMRGDIFISPKVRPSNIRQVKPKPVDQLTERQREILQCISEGITTKGIALVLKVSPKTVEYHRVKLMERLHIQSVPALCKFAFENKLAGS